MDRREFLVASGSAVLASVGLGSPPREAFATPLPAAPSRALTLTVGDADSVSWALGQARELARRIELASNGRYAVAVADAVKVKAIGLNFLRASQLVEVDHAFAFATGLPGTAALDAQAVDTWMHAAGGQAALDELAADHGLKVLLAAHGGETFLWSAQPLRTAADFAGKCVQAEGLACHVAAGLGAEPWRIARGTSAGLLASGEVAALEASVPDAIALGLMQQARFAATGALAPRGHAGALTIRLDLWNVLSPADRTIITTAARENYRQSVRMNRLGEALNRRALQRAYAIEVIPVPPGFAASIQTVARAVAAQAATNSPHAAKLNASYMGFLSSQQDLTAQGATV